MVIKQTINKILTCINFMLQFYKQTQKNTSTVPSCTGTVIQRYSVKKVFLEISQNSQENTCARVSFLIKKKRTPSLLVAASGLVGFVTFYDHISIETSFKYNTSKAKAIQKKQPYTGVLRKRYSENMQQIYRRTPMPKSEFNKVALQLC